MLICTMYNYGKKKKQLEFKMSNVTNCFVKKIQILISIDFIQKFEYLILSAAHLFKLRINE